MRAFFHVPTIVPLSCSNQLKVHNLKLVGRSLHSLSFFLNYVPPWNFGKYMNTEFQSYPCYVSKSSFMKCANHSYQPVTEEGISPAEYESQDQDNEKLESPWEGAIIYKRNATESHIFELEIIGCVADPAAESIFSNFTLLLNEEAVAEADIINMGVIYGEDKVKSCDRTSEEDEESLIDLEDQLYFPPEEREIDISKHVRDVVHLEITIDAVCDARCKGMCLKCGVNLNVRSCNWGKEEAKNKPSHGPPANLRRQMAETESV